MARVRGCVRGECAGTGSQELARLSLVPVLVPGSLPCCFASALPRTLNMYVGMYLRNPSPSTRKWRRHFVLLFPLYASYRRKWLVRALVTFDRRLG